MMVRSNHAIARSHPPLSETKRWDALHGQWPAMIVQDLNRRLPSRFVASPRIHLGPGPEFEVDVSASDTDEYEVQIHDELGQLVAAVEIVSPANKDRPQSRRTFVAKCASLFQQGVSVS